VVPTELQLIETHRVDFAVNGCSNSGVNMRHSLLSSLHKLLQFLQCVPMGNKPRLGFNICIRNAKKASIVQQQGNVFSLEMNSGLQAVVQTLHICRHQARSADAREGKRGHLYSSTCSLRGQPSWRACSVQAALPGQDGDTTAYSHMSHLQMRQSMSSVSVYMPFSSTAPAAEGSEIKAPVPKQECCRWQREAQVARHRHTWRHGCFK